MVFAQRIDDTEREGEWELARSLLGPDALKVSGYNNTTLGAGAPSEVDRERNAEEVQVARVVLAIEDDRAPGDSFTG